MTFMPLCHRGRRNYVVYNVEHLYAANDIGLSMGCVDLSTSWADEFLDW